jgi:hypothetical protein
MKLNGWISGFVLGVALAVGSVTAADGKAAKAKPYPLDVCVVSGEKFGGDMGEPYVFVYEGREVKLCCKSCKKDFDKDTAKFVAKIDEAAKKVKPYKLTTCVVSGEKLGDDAYVFIVKGQEVRLCCKDCAKEFNKDSAKYLKKLETASK